MKKKFRIIGVAVALAVVASLAFGSVALAADPIDVDVTWTGSGSVGGTVTAGSTLATTNWQSVGSDISGIFTANYNVGGGPYGGNSYTTSIDADVAGGGFIEFETVRGALGYTNSGNLETGGQQSYSYIGSSGTASMATRTAGNAVFYPFSGVFTGLGDNTYGWIGENFRASGTSYQIIRQIIASDGDFAHVIATGSGTAALDVGGSKASAGQADLAYLSGYNFGWNQDFSATGTGTLGLTGIGNNQVTFYNISQTNPVPGSSSGGWTGTIGITPDGKGLTVTGSPVAALQIITGFLNGLSCPNISMTAK